MESMNAKFRREVFAVHRISAYSAVIIHVLQLIYSALLFSMRAYTLM
jgi:hypothetical protein